MSIPRGHDFEAPRESFTPRPYDQRVDMDQLAQHIHGMNVKKGFYEGLDRDNVHHVNSKLALVHTEVSEIVEAFRRDPKAPCDKNNGLTCEEEEVADVIIRMLDFAAWRGVNVTLALKIKLETDANRAHMHGKRC